LFYQGKYDLHQRTYKFISNQQSALQEQLGNKNNEQNIPQKELFPFCDLKFPKIILLFMDLVFPIKIPPKSYSFFMSC